MKRRPVTKHLHVMVVALASGGLIITATGSALAWEWDLPSFVSPPPVPTDNPMSASKVELGRRLFYDARLSRDGTMACSSCHRQEYAFAEGRSIAIGIDGDPLPRNTQPLANVAYLPVLTWANPHLDSLEVQALVPLFGLRPAEMGGGGHEEDIFDRLMRDPYYRKTFAEVFPSRPEADRLTISSALAAFQRSLTSFDSPYDRYRHGGEPDAITDVAKRGERLFFDVRLVCFQCQSGALMTDSMQMEGSRWAEVHFHDTSVRGPGAGGPLGLAAHTGRAQDARRFRTPTLRNVAVTAPYMHDGSMHDLEEVVRHYAAGRQFAQAGPSGIGPGFEITEQEVQDLVAFLESLTDETFLIDPRHANPWPKGDPVREGQK
ncbi:MAG: cytochrome c peroxidase [Pseudomonadota bacterium]